MKRIIFFDGHCGLCNGFVDFILKIDSDHLFYFSPLQSETAKATLSDCDLSLDSVVVSLHGSTYRKSEAVGKVFIELKGFWSFLGHLMIWTPAPIRNFVYDFVASHRYKVFGRTESCRLPTAAEKKYFILE